MSLIERLKSAGSKLKEGSWGYIETVRLTIEAATEIERLETALRDRDAAIRETFSEGWMARHDYPECGEEDMWLESKAKATIDREQEANK